MCKKCVKCETDMKLEEGVYICMKCLGELVDYKRKKWEEESKAIDDNLTIGVENGLQEKN